MMKISLANLVSIVSLSLIQFVLQCQAVTFRFLVDKSYLKVKIVNYDIFSIVVL